MNIFLSIITRNLYTVVEECTMLIHKKLSTKWSTLSNHPLTRENITLKDLSNITTSSIINRKIVYTQHPSAIAKYQQLQTDRQVQETSESNIVQQIKYT